MIDVQTNSTGYKTVCGESVARTPVCGDMYPEAPYSWPETSSITGPYSETDGKNKLWEFYIDLNNCSAPLPACPLLHGAPCGERCPNTSCRRPSPPARRVRP